MRGRSADRQRTERTPRNGSRSREPRRRSRSRNRERSRSRDRRLRSRSMDRPPRGRLPKRVRAPARPTGRHATPLACYGPNSLPPVDFPRDKSVLRPCPSPMRASPPTPVHETASPLAQFSPILPSPPGTPIFHTGTPSPVPQPAAVGRAVVYPVMDSADFSLVV